MALSSTNIALAALGTQAVGGAANAYTQSRAISAQGGYQKQLLETNARIAEINAADALRRGERLATEQKRAGRRLVGEQRVALAAQGVEIDSGSALQLQEETAGLAAQEALTTRNNAWREAWGYKTEALAANTQGRMAEIGARNESRQTLLTGGLEFIRSGLAAGYYYKQGKENKGAPSSKIRRTQNYDFPAA